MTGTQKEQTIEITEQIQRDLDKFKKKMGYKCNLENPQTHAEHVMRKKYIDRNPLLTQTADKIRVRQYIREKLGTDDLVSNRFETYDIDTALKNIKLPCVLKANNASGRNLFLFSKYNERKVREILEKWMTGNYGIDKGEWCYKNIKQGIVIEPLVFDSEHIIYRFLTFNGKVKYIHAHKYVFVETIKGLQPEATSCSTYDRNWNFINVKYKDLRKDKEEKPVNLSEMIDIAEKLGQPFDYVRIDLMNGKHGLVFSEMTHYPVSGKCRFTPGTFDKELGTYWEKRKIEKPTAYYVWFDKDDAKFRLMKTVMEYSFTKHNDLKIKGKKSSYPKIRSGKKNTHEENIFKLKHWKDKVKRTKSPLLLIDCDLLFLDNIETIFENDYDIIFTDRDYSSIKYNAGVIMVRPNEKTIAFFEKWHDISKNEFDRDNHEWLEMLKRAKGATQSTLTYMLENNITFGCKIGYLPCQIWNCAGADFQKFSQYTKVLHIKSELRKMIFDDPSIKNEQLRKILIPLVELWKRYEREAKNV